MTQSRVDNIPKISAVQSLDRILTSGFALAVLANVLWGSTFLATAHALSGMGPFTTSLLRFSIACLSLGLFSLMLPQKIQLIRSAQELKWISATCLTAFVGLYSFQVAALQWIPTSISSSIVLLSPLFLIFMQPWRSIRLKAVIWALIGIGGGLLIITGKSHMTDAYTLSEHWYLGCTFTIASALLLALSAKISKKAMQYTNQLSLTFWSMLFSLPCFLIGSFFEIDGSNLPTLSGNTIFSIIYLGVICSAFAFTIWNYAIAHTTPQKLATSMHIKTPVAVLLGILFNGEMLSFISWLGVFVVFFAVYISQDVRSK